MKRMTLIAAMLSLVMLTTVGAGVVTAQSEKMPASHRVAQYDVTYNEKVVGKLIINTNTGTYDLNARGLDAGTKYYLIWLGTPGTIASATATTKGDLRMHGAWDPQYATVTQGNPTFVLALGPLAMTGEKEQVSMWAHWWTTLFTTTVHGAVHALDGTPIANRVVYIAWYHPETHKQTLWETTTKSDGTFSKTKAFSLSTVNPEVGIYMDAYQSPDEVFFYNGHTYICPGVFAKFEG